MPHLVRIVFKVCEMFKGWFTIAPAGTFLWPSRDLNPAHLDSNNITISYYLLSNISFVPLSSLDKQFQQVFCVSLRFTISVKRGDNEERDAQCIVDTCL